MKILFISLVHPPEAVGGASMIGELADDLAASGHDVTVATGWPNHPYGKLFDGYKVKWRDLSRFDRHKILRVAHAINPKKSVVKRLWTYFTLAINILLNAPSLGKQDVVVCFFLPFFGGWTAWLLSRIWRARFVHVVFDLWPEAIRNAGMISDSNVAYRATRWLDSLNFDCCDEIATLGDGMKAEIIARGIQPDKVKVVPFWADAEKIRPLPRENDWRKEHDIPLDKFVALYAGTIGYVSGAQILIETAKILSSRQDILLLVVGEGVIKTELEELARREKLSNMKLLPLQPAEQLSAMLSTADVGLITLLPQSGFSSVPSKVLGYMSAGRAVIASAEDDTDTAKLVRTAQIGVVTKVQDSKALADGIISLADSPESCREMGLRAREYLIGNYSREVIVPKYAGTIIGQE